MLMISTMFFLTISLPTLGVYQLSDLSTEPVFGIDNYFYSLSPSLWFLFIIYPFYLFSIFFDFFSTFLHEVLDKFSNMVI